MIEFENLDFAIENKDPHDGGDIFLGQLDPGSDDLFGFEIFEAGGRRGVFVGMGWWKDGIGNVLLFGDRTDGMFSWSALKDKEKVNMVRQSVL